VGRQNSDSKINLVTDESEIAVCNRYTVALTRDIVPQAVGIGFRIVEFLLVHIGDVRVVGFLE
jgi:hypothetical protein